ncbi:conserved virulence factor C family protein [Paenibacillus chartarius]|uniref:Conserved virulence factor C family protein n=1 Tax=Paenibacillus chartarius TaxID=747481 RepID=A0ABV6DGB0_9BACL
MKLISIEPTPSPNSMKLNLDESLPPHERRTYTAEQASSAPEYAQRLLAIPGVRSLYHAADFIALDRTPKGDWQAILSAARAVLGEAPGAAPASPEAASPGNAAGETDGAFGEVTVLLQTFRGIPLQVRAQAGGQEARVSMPERFTNAAIEAGKAAPNLIKERQLQELGVRYGDLQDVLAEIVQEQDASYSDERLQQLVAASYAAAADSSAASPGVTPPPQSDTGLAEQLRSPDWKERYAAMQRIQPSLETLPLLAGLLDDENASVRRLAVVYIGDIREPEALPHLFRALRDRTPSVRRTAGDTLSDIGDPAAIPAMIDALRDDNKLVRWRAARFLYEVGDATAIPALREAANDTEFEIRMQANLALERIEGGRAAEGSVWQQMTRRND